MAGIPSAVIRFAAHIPFGMQAFGSLSHYHTVKKLEVLQNLPYNHNILRAERIAGVAGVFGFVWNFIMWIPTGAASGDALGFIGLVDLGITAALLVAVCLQATYLPHSMGACRNAETWQVPNGTLSFFSVYGNHNTTPIAAREVCKSFVQLWIMGIAISVMYALSTILNLTLSGPRCKPSYDSGAGRYGFVPRALEWIHKLVILLIPRPILSRVNYSRRYLSKLFQRRNVVSEMKLQSLSGKARSEGKTNDLAKFLCYDVLVLLARELHYIDLLNLSLTSKSIRQAVFPQAELVDRSTYLKLYSCDKFNKSKCWNCNIQVCVSCSSYGLYRRNTSFSHVTNCQAYCADCYWRTGRRTTFSRKCACRQSRAATTCWDYHSVCRWCNMMSQEGDFAPQAEEREILEIQKLARLELRCSSCMTVLPSKRPQWWLCKRCGFECTSHIHPCWGVKLEERV